MEESILVQTSFALVVFNTNVPARVLVTMDRFLSMALGRPTAIQSEECVIFCPYASPQLTDV
jgi:hypothetical protein